MRTRRSPTGGRHAAPSIPTRRSRVVRRPRSFRRAHRRPPADWRRAARRTAILSWPSEDTSATRSRLRRWPVPTQAPARAWSHPRLRRRTSGRGPTSCGTHSGWTCWRASGVAAACASSPPSRTPWSSGRFSPTSGSRPTCRPPGHRRLICSAGVDPVRRRRLSRADAGGASPRPSLAVAQAGLGAATRGLATWGGHSGRPGPPIVRCVVTEARRADRRAGQRALLGAKGKYPHCPVYLQPVCQKGAGAVWGRRFGLCLSACAKRDGASGSLANLSRASIRKSHQ